MSRGPSDGWYVLPWVAAALLATLAAWGSAAGAEERVPAWAMKAAARHSVYDPLPERHWPALRRASAAELGQALGLLPAEAEDFLVEAYYSLTENTVYVADDATPPRSYCGYSVLVHEAVHALQAYHGMTFRMEQWEREAEAHEAQAAFYREEAGWSIYDGCLDLFFVHWRTRPITD